MVNKLILFKAVITGLTKQPLTLVELDFTQCQLG